LPDDAFVQEAARRALARTTGLAVLTAGANPQPTNQEAP